MSPMIWKITDAANNSTKGTMAESNSLNFLRVLCEDALMSTLNDRTMTRSRDIRTPIIPLLMVCTKEVAADVNESAIAKLMTDHN
jgi:hypothetical protein